LLQADMRAAIEAAIETATRVRITPEAVRAVYVAIRTKGANHGYEAGLVDALRELGFEAGLVDALRELGFEVEA
jgi:hypothetical protein